MRLFGLIGYPLGHSFSGKYFAEKFSREGITDARYDLFPIASIDVFSALWTDHPDLVGLNVTIPYKAAVIPFLDQLSPVVAEIGACNCILRKAGKLHGFNTDVVGFDKTLEAAGDLPDGEALVLGTGGASRAVDYVLAQRGIPFRHVSRHPGDNDLRYEELTPAVMDRCRLIINTTPLGMAPNVDEYPKIPYGEIGPRHLLIDLIYNPSTTRFMAFGAERGARVANGALMLVEQAEESWRIWNAS